ncbi:MAG: right-handed parallel beta-helix repeat-containing protein [Deltaproteobacteria bacterium]|nr:right-handed parallel beta-helix repeat-containing protein [Deltaproteobacteria bacterium]
MSRQNVFFLSLPVVFSALSASAAAADLYVAPNGRSGNAGTSAAPFDRITTALNRARPGDRVLVRAGTYPGGGWISASGTAAAPIRVVSVDGPRRAVIAGGSETLRIGDAASYLSFEGLELRNSTNNLIHIDGGSHHIWLRDVYAHHAGVDGDVLKVNQARSIYLERSEFAFPGVRTGSENPSQECIDFVDVDDIVVRDSYIHDGGNSMMYAKGGAQGVVFENNVIAGQRAGAIDPMVGLGASTDSSLLGDAQFEAIDIVFRNNVVIGGVAGAVGVYDGQNVVIANNLFLNNNGGVVEFRAGSGPLERSEDVSFVNNLVVDTRGRMSTVLRRSSHGLNAFVVSHNLFWNNGQAVLPRPCSTWPRSLVTSWPTRASAHPRRWATAPPSSPRSSPPPTAPRPRRGSTPPWRPSWCSTTSAACAATGATTGGRGSSEGSGRADGRRGDDAHARHRRRVTAPTPVTDAGG